jgi:hypothetical protein
MTFESAVPADESPYRCPYCDRPFRRDEYRTLHIGLEHYDVMTDEETARFQDQYREETSELRLFRLKLFGLLVLVYFGMLILYSVAT